MAAAPPIHPPRLPFVSVIIPIYNGETDIPDLVHGLMAQTYPADRVEYLLVDNGSRDRTWELLEQAAIDGQTQGVILRPLQESQIQSSYAARNAGIRQAQGEFLAFTDADCRPQPQWLAALVEPFGDPGVGLVAGEITALPGDTLYERYAERHDVLSQKHTLQHHFLPYGQTANLAVRKAALLSAGLFRPYLTTGGDADLCWRVLQSNWQIQFAPDAIVQHRHRASLAELLQQWRRYGRSNRFLHELHPVPLMRNLSLQEHCHSWGRWVIKEIPRFMVRAIAGRPCLVDFVDTPLAMLCTRARAQGQRQAQLPDAARQIDWLTPQETVLPPSSPLSSQSSS